MHEKWFASLAPGGSPGAEVTNKNLDLDSMNEA